MSVPASKEDVERFNLNQSATAATVNSVADEQQMPGRFYHPDHYSPIAQFVLAAREKMHAQHRAHTLWGENAWVLDHSDLHTKLFIVSSGDGTNRHYGEGNSWDSAFADAGAGLFVELD